MFYFQLNRLKNEKTRLKTAGLCKKGQLGPRQDYFCQVRFLWRFAFRRFRRLCFDIFRRRFFFRLPIDITVV